MPGNQDYNKISEYIDGTFSYLDAGGEQIVIEITDDVSKIVQGIWCDMTAFTQNGKFKLYYKIDGTNYRQLNLRGTIQQFQYTVADGIDGFYIAINLGVHHDFKVTYEEDVDEGAARSMPYCFTYNI